MSEPTTRTGLTRADLDTQAEELTAMQAREHAWARRFFDGLDEGEG